LLHLGCATTAPPEWVNVDASLNSWIAQRPWLKKIIVALRLVPSTHAALTWPANILTVDLRSRLPFADNSFDAAYSSHTMEHLYRAQALAALKEVHRVLQPGGFCRTLVPDLGVMARDYLRDMTSPGGPAQNHGMDSARWLMTRLGFRGENPPREGGLYGIYIRRTEFHDHKWMYDVPSLQHLMEEAGFRHCEPKGCLETRIPLLEKVEMPDRTVDAAIVEGVKE
jgi:SAM-dependent methyltransferase